MTLKITPKALKFSKTTVGTSSKPKNVKVSNPKGNKKHPGLPVLIEMISDPAGVHRDQHLSREPGGRLILHDLSDVHAERGGEADRNADDHQQYVLSQAGLT